MSRRLFALGPLAIVIFDLSWLIDGQIEPGYSPMTMYVSDLAFFPNGWLLNTTFIVSGLLLLGFAYVLARGIGDRIVAWLVAIVALGLIGSGFFPETPAHDPMRPHAIIALVAFTSQIATLFVAGYGSRQAGRMAAGYARWAAPVALVLLVALVVAAAPTAIVQPPPLAPWLGLVQRAFLVPWHLWVIVVGVLNVGVAPARG